ncbi:MAG: outer membrane beta-barrel protein [Chromatiales bacterium]|jgi:OOP family OmpA-OmpF porin
MKKQVSVAVFGTFFLSPAAFAQNGYLGIGLGSASYSAFVDESDTGFSIYGGFKANEYFGLELQYTDFGTQLGTSDTYFKLFETTVEISGLGFSGVGFLPLSPNFDLFLKAGVFAWNVDESVDSTVSIGSDSDDGDGYDPLFGFGAEYQFTDHFSIRSAWETVNVEGSYIDMFSISAQLNF